VPLAQKARHRRGSPKIKEALNLEKNMQIRSLRFVSIYVELDALNKKICKGQRVRRRIYYVGLDAVAKK